MISLKRFLSGLVILTIVTGNGCKSQPSEQHVGRKRLLSIWHLKDASAEERAHAVNKWITAGTDGNIVVNLLGYPHDGWNHFHGQSVDEHGNPAGPFDYWTLTYPCSNNNFVTLIFNHVAKTDNFCVTFDHALVTEPPVTFTNTYTGGQALKVIR